MIWITLSITAAFGQALGWAIKKRVLNDSRFNNTLGFVSYAVAGGVLFIPVLMDPNLTVSSLNASFWHVTFWVVMLNILAVWAAYKALDIGDFHKLMPFIALTAVLIVPIEWLLRGVLPTLLQFVGMVVIALGAIVFAIDKAGKRSYDFRAYLYFGITLFCYSLASSLMSVAVERSGSGILSAAIFLVGISIGFFILLLATKEYVVVWQYFKNKKLLHPILWMVAAGLVNALLENGPITIALETAKASEVFALKRLMPIFALIIGYAWFKERHVSRRKIYATAAMVVGSFVVVWFR